MHRNHATRPSSGITIDDPDMASSHGPIPAARALADCCLSFGTTGQIQLSVCKSLAE